MNEKQCNPRIVVITGAESTGKSILTLSLSEHYQCPCFTEYAREYIGNLNRNYLYEDVAIIAEKQAAQYEQAKKMKAPFVFFDTWLIITKVWFEVVYGKKPDWLEPFIRTSEIYLFLVCDVDLDWIPDPVRENGGEMRKKLHQMYINNLKDYGFNYSVVTGSGEMRLRNAINSINSHNLLNSLKS